MFARDTDITRISPERIAGKVFATNVELCGTRSVSTRDRGHLLASPDLAQRASRFQAFNRRRDVSGATGKESHRLPTQIASAGGLLATANYCRAVAS
jgi:hypothetical protein